MILPDPYRDELFARLHDDIAETKLRRILDLMRMGMPAETPIDFDALASRSHFDGRHPHRGVIPFEAEFEAFGIRRKLYFRYVYLCELEEFEDEPPTPNQVGRLEVLTWERGARSPEWEQVPVGLLGVPTLEVIDELLLNAVTTGKSTASP